jgi:hypothetical protein
MTTIRNLFALSILTLTMTSVLACDPPEGSDGGDEDFRFLLPTVCAGTCGADVFVSDFECETEDWQVCEPGEFYAGATQRVCCVGKSEDDCRIALTTDPEPCSATESHLCDRNPFNNVHACSTDGEDIYIQEPYCFAGDIMLCAEAEFIGAATATAVCCDFASPQACEFVNGPGCSPFQHHVCDVGA